MFVIIMVSKCRYKQLLNQLQLNFSFSIRDNTVHTRIIEARDFPPKLLVLARAVLRDTLIEQACGKSIYPIVKKVITFSFLRNNFFILQKLIDNSTF